MRHFLKRVTIMLFCCLLCFFWMPSSFSVRASAAGLPVDGRLMTYQDAVDCFGTSIPVRYLDRSGVYHDETASIVTNNAPYSIGETSYIDDVSYLAVTRQVILYSFQTEYITPMNQTPQQVTVRLQPEYSIFDTEYIYTAIGIEISYDTNLQAYNSPVWSWVFAGQNVQFTAVNTAVNDVLPNYYLKNSNNNFLSSSAGFKLKFNFVPAYMTSQAITSGYSTEATFDNVWGDSTGGRQTIYIAIGLPYVSNGASGATGTPASTTATTTAAPSVDLGETNGLLGGISLAISNLFSKVTGIFDILDDSSIVDDTAAIDSVPDSLDYDSALDDVDQIMIDADQILDDTPQIVSGIGFYFAIIEQLFTGRAVIFKLLIPVACLLSLLSYMLWRG